MAELLPAYEIEPLPEDHVCQKVIMTSVKHEDGKHKGEHKEFQKETVDVHGGFMIYFPQGHSIFVENEEGLKEVLGDNYIHTPIIDMDSGEEAPQGYSALKSRVQAKTHNIRKD